MIAFAYNVLASVDHNILAVSVAIKKSIVLYRNTFCEMYFYEMTGDIFKPVTFNTNIFVNRLYILIPFSVYPHEDHAVASVPFAKPDKKIIFYRHIAKRASLHPVVKGGGAEDGFFRDIVKRASSYLEAF